MFIPGLDGAFATVMNFAASAELVMDTAPLYCYFCYFMAAGVGVPLSEDAMVAWVGAKILNQGFPLWKGAAYLATCYCGVVLSDVTTFYIGRALRLGCFSFIADAIRSNEANMQRANALLSRWGTYVGVASRLTIGFRGPLALVCGLSGIPVLQFARGVALGALITMPCQLLVGFLFRATPNVYVSTLALVAGPTVVGQFAGVAMAVGGLFFASKEAQAGQSKRDGEGESDGTAAAST